MSKSFSSRLLVALNRRDIPPHVRREIHNQVCGPSAEDPPAMAWDALYSEVAHHLRNLRSNKAKVRPQLMPAWQDYYDAVATIPPRIRAADKTHMPTPKAWQGWIPAEERARHIAAFATVYDAYPNLSPNGLRTVPFAPNALRAENLERVRRCEEAIAATRAAWNTHAPGTPSHPRSNTHLGAVILAAARQAEIGLTRYKRKLLRHEVHPYEEPAKTNWQHYCDADTREKVRRLYANPADVYFDFAPYAAFYSAS